jgi:cell filamentation protein
MERIAADAGWQLDRRPVRGTVNDHASRAAAEQRDFGPLQEMFAQIVSKAVHPRERDDTWRAAERARSHSARGERMLTPATREWLSNNNFAVTSRVVRHMRACLDDARKFIEILVDALNGKANQIEQRYEMTQY